MEPKLEKQHTFCRICESLCGLEVEKQGNKIISIKPDKDHVATAGFACPKGLKQHHIFSSPDRLKYPMKRVGEKWERISWEQAFSEIGKKVKQLRSDFDPNSIAMYVGTAAGFGVLHPMFAQGFMEGIGSKSLYASATQDCSNKFAVANEMYGFPFTQPFPDLPNVNCLIIVGANPIVSKWSFLQVPNPSKHLKDMKARGAKLYVVDPRYTETAKIAGGHVAINPGTDIFFYLSFLNELIRINGIDNSVIDKHTEGFEELLEIQKEWTPEKTAEVTGISPDVLKEMVKAYAEADGAALYCSTGVNMGYNGTMAFWIQECINAISGNLDKKGGALVSKGLIDFAKFGKKNGLLVRSDRSRIGDFQSVNDAFPGGVLADEILTPGDKQVKALFVTGGNPLITMANSNKLRKAFQKLELLVSLDIFPNETASVGHYMLPCTTPMERPDLPFVFPLMLGLQTKPYLQATKAVVKPEHEQLDEATIYMNLAKHAGVNMHGSKAGQLFYETISRFNKKGKSFNQFPQEFMLNLLLRIMRQKSFKSLLKDMHGLQRQAHKDDFLEKRIVTDSKKVRLAPEILVEQLPRVEAHFTQELENKNKKRFKLISKRAVTTHNSWTHNYEDFVDGGNYTNFLYMHPEDAFELNLQEKDLVDVATETGAVRVPVRFLKELQRKVVALPHGWGHQSSGLNVAKKTKGVNVNILAADGPEKIDPVSGMANLTGFYVNITAASGDQVEHSWSGLERDVLKVD
ncbi:MAG: molybdopterin-dependent oxidoreductase [Schleiferiaceae bacterium]|nr:molybdopterin-dependent oxidoreductase [Schleiferiaceae bacterium]